MKSTITVNLHNLTDEERKQLLNLVSKSHTEKKGKVWEPKKGDTYYLIDYYNNVTDNIYIPHISSEHYKLGNCFKTREEAEFALEKQKLITEIKRYIAESDPEKLNWKNRRQDKCILSYEQEYDTIIRIITTIQSMNGIYFSNKFNWKKMIEDIGEDRIKKYLFGVE